MCERPNKKEMRAPCDLQLLFGARPEFLNLGTIDILGQSILWCGGTVLCPVCPGLYPLDATSTPKL